MRILLEKERPGHGRPDRHRTGGRRLRGSRRPDRHRPGRRADAGQTRARQAARNIGDGYRLTRPSASLRPASSCTGTARRSAARRARAALPAGCGRRCQVGHVDEADDAVRIDQEGRALATPSSSSRMPSAVDSSRLTCRRASGTAGRCRSLWSLRQARCTNSLSVLRGEHLAVAVGELAVQIAEALDLGRADEGEVLRVEEHAAATCPCRCRCRSGRRPYRGFGRDGGLELELRELVANGQACMHSLRMGCWKDVAGTVSRRRGRQG